MKIAELDRRISVARVEFECSGLIANEVCQELIDATAMLRECLFVFYNYGYKHGHHDTVEGVYIDITDAELCREHADTVIDLFDERTPTEAEERDDEPR